MRKKSIAWGFLFCLAAVILMSGSPAMAVHSDVIEARNGVVRVISISADGEYLSKGSGFAVGEKGEPVEYFLTNHHVIELNPDSVYIVLESMDKGDTVIPAAVVMSSDTPDMAVLKTERPVTERTALPLLSAETLEVTQSVYALGFPGVADNVNDDKSLPSLPEDVTVTAGTVTKRQVSASGMTCVQIDAVVNNGNSGGPLVTENGCVVGINTMVALNDDDHTRADGTNYALYIDAVMEIFDQAKLPYYQGEAPAASATPEAEPAAKERNTEETEKETRRSEREEQDEEESKDGNSVWVWAGLGVAVIAVAGAALALSRKNRKGSGAKASGSVGYHEKASEFSGDSRLRGHEPGSAPSGADGGNPPAGKVRTVRAVNGFFFGKEFRVEERILIGRNPNVCHIVYPDKSPGISSVHCELRSSEDRLILTDKGSTYGTYLAGGQKLVPGQPAVLKPGETFCLGSQDNTFQVL